MSLKDATADKHDEAEKTELMQSMIDGTITREKYVSYLYQMSILYARLETLASNLGLLEEMPGIHRQIPINLDLNELKEKDDVLLPVPSLLKYLDHLQTIETQPARIMAHVYVRHLGDLYGGQILKSRLPGSGRWYDFKDPDTLKSKIRSWVTDANDMVEETIKAYEFNIAMFKEIQDGVVHDGNSEQSNTGAAV
jgi:heme oxygenase